MDFQLLQKILFFAVSATVSGAYFNNPPAGGNGLFLDGRNGISDGDGRRNGGGGYSGVGDGGFNGVDEFVDPIQALAEAIPGGGVPGEDYPILAFVPETGFTCTGLIPGYYADTNQESSCQVFYICQEDGRTDAFLCPNGTLFNQQYFVCDWWYNVDCSSAAQFYGLNAEIGKVPAGAGGNGFGVGGIGGGYSNGNGASGGGLGGVGGGSQVPGELSTTYGVPSANGIGGRVRGSGVSGGVGLGLGGTGSAGGLTGGFGGTGSRPGSDRLTPPTLSSSYAAPSNGISSASGEIRRGSGNIGSTRNGGGGRIAGSRGGGGGAGRVQAPSGLYQTPGR